MTQPFFVSYQSIIQADNKHDATLKFIHYLIDDLREPYTELIINVTNDTPNSILNSSLYDKRIIAIDHRNGHVKVSDVTEEMDDIHK